MLGATAFDDEMDASPVEVDVKAGSDVVDDVVSRTVVAEVVLLEVVRVAPTVVAGAVVREVERPRGAWFSSGQVSCGLQGSMEQHPRNPLPHE